MSRDVQALVCSVGNSLASYGFRDRWRPALSALDCLGLWRLCTLNVNRAVALLAPTAEEFAIGPYCQRMKWRLLRKMWFLPLLYEVGLQLIVVDQAADVKDHGADSISAFVDAFSNQMVTLQSIFFVETRSGRFTSARTWGQIITGKYQDAISAGVSAAGFAAS